MREYIERLRQTTTALTVPERARVSYLKMYLNYIAQSVDAEGLSCARCGYRRPKPSFTQSATGICLTQAPSLPQSPIPACWLALALSRLPAGASLSRSPSKPDK